MNRIWLPFDRPGDGFEAVGGTGLDACGFAHGPQLPAQGLLAQGPNVGANPLWSVLFSGGVMPVVIGGLLALLATGILVTVLTRWGAQRPILSCVILSVVAHLLLFALATGTGVFTPPPPAGRADEPLRVTMLEPFPIGEGEGDPDAPQGWQRHAETSFPIPDLAAMMAAGLIGDTMPVPGRDDLPDTAGLSPERVDDPPTATEPPPASERDQTDADVSPVDLAATDAPLPPELAESLAALDMPEPPPVTPLKSPVPESSRTAVTPSAALPPAPLPDWATPTVPTPTTSPDKPTDRPPSVMPPVPALDERPAPTDSVPLDSPKTDRALPSTAQAITVADAPSTQDLADMLAGALDVLDTPPAPVEPKTLRDVSSETPRGEETVRTASDTPPVRETASLRPEDDGPKSQSKIVAATLTNRPADKASSDQVTVTPSRQPVRVATGPVPAFARLGDGGEVPGPYRLRVSPERSTVMRDLGGDDNTESAIAAALDYLARVQNADGSWSATEGGGGTEVRPLESEPTRPGIGAETGITGLALLAFLGHGESHFEGPHRQTVRRGLTFLVTQQRPDGNLSGRASLFARMYCHAMATLAIGEALALSGDGTLRPAVERAIGHTISSQDRSGGGWRYQPGDTGDMSQFGWQIMAIETAEQAGLIVPRETKSRAIGFLRSVLAGENRGLARYRALEQPSHTMTAEAVVCRQILRVESDDAQLTEAATDLLSETPGHGAVNYYYWYYGTLAARRLDRATWDQWYGDLKETVLPLQIADGEARGSWAADKVWGGYGGQVYSTALAALALESVYRFDAEYEQARVAERSGVLSPR